MVKTRAIVLMLCVAGLGACGVLGRSERASPQRLVIAQGRLGRTVSLVRAGGTLVAIYSDQETTGLYAVEVPVSEGFPSSAPAAAMIDRIDQIPPLSPLFGEHAAFARGNAISVLYAAREAAEKPVLKLASSDLGAPAWTLDAVEPAGDPVAILAAGSGRLDLFWAAGSLLQQSYPGAGEPDLLVDSFVPGDRAASLGSPARDGDPAASDAAADNRGITVYDSISGSLLVFRWNGYAYLRTSVAGAGPVQASRLLPDGRLVVLSWNQKTRRLELLKEKPGGTTPSRTIVTLSEGTNAVALLPSSDRASDRFLFVYDETHPQGGGKAAYELSLLAPGWGGRYHRVVLDSADRPITDFAALEAGGALYALVLRDSLALLRVALP